MKKKIFLLGLSLFLVPSVVLAASCDSENTCSGENVSNTCSYQEDINNSCHYECTENSKLVMPGSVLGDEGVLAGTGFAFPFHIETDYVCTLVHHPEDPGPRPPEPGREPQKGDYYRTVCDTCCESCYYGSDDYDDDDDDDDDDPEPSKPSKPSGGSSKPSGGSGKPSGGSSSGSSGSSKPSGGSSSSSGSSGSKKPGGGGGGGGCPWSERPCRVDMFITIIKPWGILGGFFQSNEVSESSVWNAKLSMIPSTSNESSKVSQMSYCDCGSYSCNCRSVYDSSAYESAHRAWEERVRKLEEWKANKARIDAEIARCKNPELTKPVYSGTTITKDPSRVSLTIEEVQNGVNIGRTFKYGELEYFDEDFTYGELEYENGAFRIKAPYIKKGTGEVEYNINSLDFYERAYYHQGGNYYYTDLMTQNGCYGIKISANSIGRSCKVNLEADCAYQLKNKFFCEDDECKDGSGGVQYVFRSIDLNDVFPNDREPRWNWGCGATFLEDDDYPVKPVTLTEEIEEKGYKIYGTSDSEYDSSNDLDYEITLTPDVMRKVRQYNRSRGSYLSYDDYCYYNDKGQSVCSSNFLHEELAKYGNNVLNKTGLVGCNNQLDVATCDISKNVDSCQVYLEEHDR